MYSKVTSWRSVTAWIKILGEETAYVYVWGGFTVYLIGVCASIFFPMFKDAGLLQTEGKLSEHIIGFKFLPIFILFGFLSGGLFLVAKRIYKATCPEPIQNAKNDQEIEAFLNEDCEKIRQSASNKMLQIAKLRQDGFDSKKQYLNEIIQNTYGKEGVESFFASMLPYIETSQEIDNIRQLAEERIKSKDVASLDVERPEFRLIIMIFLSLSAICWLIHVIEVAAWIFIHIAH